MRLVIQTLGTRGDVQPYVALGLGLKAAGFAVRLSAPKNFRNWIEGTGLDFAPSGADIQAFLQTPEGKDLMRGTPWAIYRNFKTVLRDFVQEMIDCAWDAARDAEVLVYHPKVPIAVDIAEKLRVPIVATVLQPMLVPTAEFPCLGVGSRSLGATLNRLTYKLVRVQRAMFHKQFNDWRREVLGLGPLGRFHPPGVLDDKPIALLHGYSAHVVPRPADWPDWAQVTGYWFLDDAAWQMPSDLKAFLDAGPPPVYVGFGSMTGRDPETRARIVVEALGRAGVRGIVAQGWGGLEATDLPETIFALDEAPHDRLFPKMAAVVHHGGAGSVGAGLRAGKPTVVCPFLVDQPFWGARVAALGAGPKPVPQKRITVDRLARAIDEAVSSAAIRQRADEIGAAIRAEDGVATAVGHISRLLSV